MKYISTKVITPVGQFDMNSSIEGTILHIGSVPVHSIYRCVPIIGKDELDMIPIDYDTIKVIIVDCCSEPLQIRLMIASYWLDPEIVWEPDGTTHLMIN